MISASDISHEHIKTIYKALIKNKINLSYLYFKQNGHIYIKTKRTILSWELDRVTVKEVLSPNSLYNEYYRRRAEILKESLELWEDYQDKKTTQCFYLTAKINLWLGLYKKYRMTKDEQHYESLMKTLRQIKI